MTTRYVGKGGNDGNSGLTWVLRKLTLNGAEDTPVVAGDVIYVGPGAYRELLTVDVSGGAATIITYIGDVTGENTDGVGGIVRVTGSDNDQTAVRANCIVSDTKDYRTFRGFTFDTITGDIISGVSSSNWIIEDCSFQSCLARSIFVENGTDWTIRRCFFILVRFQHIDLRADNPIDNSGHLIENCMFLTVVGDIIHIRKYGDVIVRNCIFAGGANSGARVVLSPNANHPLIVNNCLLIGFETAAVRASVLGDIVEDFNTFYINIADRINVAVGANSVTYPPLLALPLLHAGASQISGFKFPWWFGELSEWSQVRAITGLNEPIEDLRGIARPVTASKNSWGPLQFADMERETGTVRTGSASIVLHDAGRHQIWVPVEASSTTIKIYVYREANYAGLLPQMIIKQPGQADDVTTDVGGAGGWNLLTTTLVPAALPPYVIVELVSRNTAAAGNYKTFFDDLDVS